MNPSPGFRLRLMHAEAANLFMRELLEQIAFEARLAGVDAQVIDGDFPPGDDIVYVVVPHEYFIVRPPARWPSTELLSRTIALAVEPPGTPSFEVSADHARRCAIVMDINAKSIDELHRRGVSVLPFQLGYSEYFDHWHGVDRSRQNDIVYLGTSDPRRDALLASYSRWWLSRRVSLFIPSRAPGLRASDSHLAGADKYALLAQSRILVNLHRGESRSFEWVRALQAMANGAVVISEHSVDSLPLVAGEHFVAAEPDSVGLLARHLLDDDACLVEMRAAAYNFIREELLLSRSVGELLEVCDQLVEHPLTPTHHALPVTTHAVDPLPWEVVEAGAVALLGAEVSSLRHRIRKLEIIQNRLQGQAGYLNDGAIPMLQTRAYAAARPRISVIVPVFNKAPFVVAALDSVVACGRADVEILLLDDCSSDQSAARITAWIRDHPDTPAAFLTRATNGGVARTRNALLARARGEFVFTLDADNGVYPTALDAFAAVLDENPEGSFAYGPIEVRRDGGFAGLLSPRSLDVDEIRYGNYVDSMAMFRTTALREVGGWNDALHTWEDYELWLRFLEKDISGVFVPQVHAWYVMRDGTLRTAADLELIGVWSQLRASAPTILAGPPVRHRPERSD